MTCPSISFIVPAYNVEHYIDECISSIIKAAEDGDEIIIVNDGSTDGTHRICLNWAQAYPGLLIYENQENSGLSAARNAGFKKSRGDYIVFMDSDDVMNYESVQVARDILREKGPEILVMDFLWWRPESNTKISPPKHSHEPNTLLTDKLIFCHETFKDSLFSACSRIYRRNLLEKFSPDLFPPGRYYEEIYAVPRITLQAKSLYYLPVPLFFYRLRSGSITQSKTPERCKDLATALRQVIKDIKESSAVSSKELEISANMAAAIYLIKAIRDSGLVEKPSLALTKDILHSMHKTLTIPVPEVIRLLKYSGWRNSARTSRHLKIADKSECAYLTARIALNKWKSLVKAKRQLNKL